MIITLNISVLAKAKQTQQFNGLKKLKAELTQLEEERRKKEEALGNIYESAKQMKIFGMPIDAIMKATGLLREEIEKL